MVTSDRFHCAHQLQPYFVLYTAPPTYLILVPLKASLEGTLVLVDEPQSMPKLVQHCGAVQEAKVHGEGLLRDVQGICTNVRP